MLPVKRFSELNLMAVAEVPHVVGGLPMWTIQVGMGSDFVNMHTFDSHHTLLLGSSLVPEW